MLHLLRVHLIVLLLLTSAAGITNAQQRPVPKAWTDGSTEARLRSVYEKREFSGKRFRAKWWGDSKGFTVGKDEHYDVFTGERAESESSVKDTANPRGLVSPDGKLKLEVQKGSLFVVELEGGNRTQLAMGHPEREVSIRNPKWSSDGKHIAFTETDSSKVKRRSMLVPGDPSYPGVREQQFARVGGDITSLRVGIVDVAGKNKQWLPIESPDEGFYLETIEWAPNAVGITNSSNELLIERLSRGRDKREFFLATIDGKLKRIFEESDPAWVVASQARNMGLTWIFTEMRLS